MSRPKRVILFAACWRALLLAFPPYARGQQEQLEALAGQLAKIIVNWSRQFHGERKVLVVDFLKLRGQVS